MQTAKSRWVLGITLNKQLDNIWTLNLDEKLVKIGKLLTSWRGRCGTICGRITVVKTLAMSKLIHIFTNLPNPHNEYILKNKENDFVFHL